MSREPQIPKLIISVQFSFPSVSSAQLSSMFHIFHPPQNGAIYQLFQLRSGRFSAFGSPSHFGALFGLSSAELSSSQLSSVQLDFSEFSATPKWKRLLMISIALRQVFDFWQPQPFSGAQLSPVQLSSAQLSATQIISAQFSSAQSSSIFHVFHPLQNGTIYQ